MWTADKWTDYRVLAAGGGEKLEKWGNYRLLRPDPQVIWPVAGGRKLSKGVNAHYHRSDRGGGEWEFFDLPEKWTINYESLGLTFNLKPFSFKHTGLFPEQAVNWEWFYNIIKSSGRKEPKVLNLFAYTGGATIAAAKAGAFVTHVDASKGVVAWAKENAASSGIPGDRIRWLTDDCVKFVERELRRGNRYDGIIMDPPSYGRGPKGELWRMEDDIYGLVSLCSGLLSEKPLFFLLNSYTTGLQPAVLSYLLSTAIASEHGGRVSADEVGLPIEENGLILPCGAAGRVEF